MKTPTIAVQVRVVPVHGGRMRTIKTVQRAVTKGRHWIVTVRGERKIVQDPDGVPYVLFFTKG